MIYISLSKDKNLMVTKYTPIYRGEHISDSLIFLLPVKIDHVDLATASVFLSYIRADGEPDMVILNRSNEKYNNNYYQYVLPVTCDLDRYPGQVRMWIQICDGSTCEPIILKTGECTIQIHASKNLDVCDHQLTAMYQLKKKVDELSQNYEEDCRWNEMEDPDQDGTWEDMVVDPEFDLGDIWEDM